MSETYSASMKTKIVGLNRFLTTIYDTDMRISILLSEIGYDPHQIQFLRHNYLEDLINGCILLLNQRITAYSGGDRLSIIINQRYGLDGQSSQTLQAIGDELNISRERVRQLEQKIIRRFKGRKNHQLVEAGLKVIADNLLNDIEIIPRASSPLDNAPLEFISEMDNVTNSEPAEKPTHIFDYEETQEGNVRLVIRELRANGDVAEIVVLEDEVEQFYLDFHKSMKLGGWQKHLKSYRLSDIRKQYPRAYEEWTNDEEAYLIEMFEEGKMVSDIARYLERQPGAVRSRLSKLNLHNENRD